jgi:hypothetical protein
MAAPLILKMKESLDHSKFGIYHPAVMRIAMTMIVALLLLNFLDEHFNDARHTRGWQRQCLLI